MRVDIIGGSGFIGTRLCRSLLRKEYLDVRVIDLVPSPVLPCHTASLDICALDALVDAVRTGAVIVHLAAEHRDDVRPIERYAEVNVAGTRNVVEAARQKEVPVIIFTSSVAVYGLGRSGVVEDDPKRPLSEYGRTKLAAEKILMEWQQERPDQRTLVIVRPTVVFGEGNRGNMYNLICSISSSRFVMVGSGRNRKSVAYVGNVAALLEHLLVTQPGIFVYNYVDKPDLTVSELVIAIRNELGLNTGTWLWLPYFVGYAIGLFGDLVGWILGKPCTISSTRVHKFCSDSVFATRGLPEGFVAPMSLSNGLRNTIMHDFHTRARLADD